MTGRFDALDGGGSRLALGNSSMDFCEKRLLRRGREGNEGPHAAFSGARSGLWVARLNEQGIDTRLMP